MSILTNSGSVLTKEQKQAQTAIEAAKITERAFARMVRVQKEGIDLVWNNPNGLTPQEVCDGFGENAASIFMFHGAVTEAIMTVASMDGIEVNLSFPTNKFTYNEDGTVTVLEEPYFGDPEVPSESPSESDLPSPSYEESPSPSDPEV